MNKLRINFVFLASGVLLLGGSAALSQAQNMTEPELKIQRQRTYAQGLMDEIEKKLQEPPDDGKFGMSRLTPLFILKVHGKNGREIFGYRLPGSPEGTRVEIHTLGLFDQRGTPARVTKGSEVFRRLGRLGGRSLIEKKEDLGEALKKTASKLYLSGGKESWTSEQVQGKRVFILARAIHPKKDCLSCHQGAQIGKALGVAAVTLVPQEAERKPTQQP